VAVAVADALPLATLVAVAAEELADLGLQGGLHDQPHAQPGDLLQDLAKLLVGGEQLVDLGADALDSRQSWGHGRGPPQHEWLALLGAYARLTFHRTWDATHSRPPVC
jgi:hypothetical protein